MNRPGGLYGVQVCSCFHQVEGLHLCVEMLGGAVIIKARSHQIKIAADWLQTGSRMTSD